MKKQTNDLLFAIQTATPFMSQDKNRTYIRGIRIENNAKAGTLNVVATCGAALILIEIKDFINMNRLPTGDYTIDYDTVKTITPLIKASNCIDISQNLKCLDDDYQFPDYRAVMTMEDSEKNTFTVNPFLMERAMTANAKLITYKNDKYAGTKITLHHPKHKVTGVDKEKVTIKTETEIDNIKITCLVMSLRENN